MPAYPLHRSCVRGISSVVVQVLVSIRLLLWWLRPVGVLLGLVLQLRFVFRNVNTHAYAFCLLLVFQLELVALSFDTGLHASDTFLRCNSLSFEG